MIRRDYDIREFYFDNVLDPESHQNESYDSIA